MAEATSQDSCSLGQMKKASIISVGNEILSGQTVNTNLSYLGSALLSIGVPVVSSYCVADEMDAILRSLKLAAAEADLVVVTGGLGPTDDDLTRQTFAKFLGVELQLQEDLLSRIEEFFTRRGLQMAERNRRQAYIPVGTEAIVNDLGTAPGIKAEVSDRLLVALPGVPSEMREMFDSRIRDDLRRFAGGQAVVVRKLRCFGAGESAIAEMLGASMRRGRNPLVNCTVSQGVVTLSVVATGESEQEALQTASGEERSLRATLGELVYGTDEQTMAEVVGDELARQGKTLALAESCTGGLVAKMLTDIPGASRYFVCGWVTYNDRAKISELGVSAEIIQRHGAVSEQVARAMARGARIKAGTDFAIGITGIAGPAGATEQKPVGLVYISVDSDMGCDIRRCTLSKNRGSIRFRAAQTALNMLRLKLMT